MNKKDIKDRDKIILRTIDKWEKGYVNDKNDSGGETRWGISKRSYPRVDIKHLTKMGAVEIYATDFYDKMDLSGIKTLAIGWKCFDMAVNMGRRAATRIIQRATGAHVDGIMGPLTLASVNVDDQNVLMFTLVYLQTQRYAAIAKRNPKSLRFLKGWIRRAFDVGDDL